jgi:ABC-type uncharacterized transport system permease subunit
MSPALPGIAAAILYAFGTITQIHALKRQTQPPRSRTLAIALPAVALHALTLALVMARPEGMNLGLFAIAALVVLVMILFVLAASHWQPLENLFILIYPMGAIVLLGAVARAGVVTHPLEALGPGLVAHALISLAAYTVLAMAATQAVALSIQEHQLRAKQRIGLLRLLPPLLAMERMLFQLLWAGLALLTLSIASGFTFLGDMFEQRGVVHHTVLSLVSWVIFAALLAGHHVLGWRGTTATRWTLAGFAFLALAYFGSKFVLEVLLN